MSESFKTVTAIVLNIVLFIMEAAVMIPCFQRENKHMFIYYTNDSNIFAGITSLIYSVAALTALSQGRAAVPEWIVMLRFMSTLGLTLTYVIVVTALAPAYGKGGYAKLLFGKFSIFVHLICPLIAFISFVFFEDGSCLSGTSALFIVMIPTLLYAVLSILLNILKKWDGPYFFLKVYNQPVYVSMLWAVIVLGGAFLLGLCIRNLNLAMR